MSVENYECDFKAWGHMHGDVDVWKINENMMIITPEGPIEITKEQAIKFWNLKDLKGDNNE